MVEEGEEKKTPLIRAFEGVHHLRHGESFVCVELTDG